MDTHNIIEFPECVRRKFGYANLEKIRAKKIEFSIAVYWFCLLNLSEIISFCSSKIAEMDCRGE